MQKLELQKRFTPSFPTASKPSLFENWVGGSTPPAERQGVHTMVPQFQFFCWSGRKHNREIYSMPHTVKHKKYNIFDKT